jgi:hypothetical protein
MRVRGYSEEVALVDKIYKWRKRERVPLEEVVDIALENLVKLVNNTIIEIIKNS